MGMYDTVYVSGTCQGCGLYRDAWEIQLKQGRRELSGWTIGSLTTLPDDVIIKDNWCWECAYTPMTEEDRIKNALEGYPITEHRNGDEVCRRVTDSPTTFVRLTLKDKVLLTVAQLKMCPGCKGHRTLPSMRALCQTCKGMGYLDEVVEFSKACPGKAHPSVFDNITPESMAEGMEFLKNLGNNKPEA